MPGSLWIDGNYLHYIDSTGKDRQVPNLHISSPAGARAGSLWGVISKLHWIASGGAEEREGHNDSVHIDTHGDVDHADSSHTDVIHVDAHTDTHGDAAHTDVPHGDSAYRFSYG